MSKVIETVRTVHVSKSKYKRKDGKQTWSYRFEMPYRRADGKRDFATKSGFTTKTSAQKAGQEEFDRIYKGVVPQINKSDDRIAELRFKDYILNYWYPYKKKLVKDTTFYGYKKKMNSILFPKFENTAIKDITDEVLEHFLNEEIYQRSVIANSTLLNLRALLKQIFNYAVNHGHLSTNPMLSATPHNPRLPPDVVKRGQCRTAIEKGTLDKIYELYPKGTIEHLSLKIMELTGMREGECFALDWRDICFEKHCIFLVRQIQRKTKEYTPTAWERGILTTHPELNDFKWYISNPKYESRRAIPMTAEVEELLQDEWECQKANRKKYGEKYKKYFYTRQTAPQYYNDFNVFNSRVSQIRGEIVTEFENGILNEIGVGYEFNPVFRRVNGAYYTSGNTQYISRKIHGYEGNELISSTFNIHSLRHTYATNMRSMGFKSYIVQSLMGHKNPATTTQVYMHLEENVFNQVAHTINTMGSVDALINNLTEEQKEALTNKLLELKGGQKFAIE